MEISEMTDEQRENIVGWLVGRMHVSASDKGVRSYIGRKLSKSVQGDDRKLLLDAAIRVHTKNREFFVNMRF
jgi:hypothetical protein